MITLLAIIAALTLPPVMPVSAIHSGQKGQCLTVFEGTAIEPFPFVVKAVMPNYLGPGRDLVLVKLLGDKTKFTGVVAGMSGSPCSIDGRLVGALSYSFATFAKEPIAGVTPIDSMRKVMRLPAEARPWRLADAKTDAASWEAMRRGEALPAHGAGTEGLVPIATPLTLGGITASVRDHFAPWLRSQGFVPVAGSAGGHYPGLKGPLVPGASVAAVLVGGDVDIAATGTVTWVDKKEVLAFGHPFLGAGAVSIPMAHAFIFNTMASQRRSFKMAGTAATVGEITEDRLTAIGGFLGRQAQMVPVTGTVHTPAGKSTFHLEVARDLGLSPRFLAIGLANALAGRIGAGARGTVRLRGEVKAAGLAPIVVRNVYAAERDGNLMIYAAIDMARTFATLWQTPFGPPPAMSVTLSAREDTQPVEDTIESVQIDRRIVRPGHDLEVAVRLRRMKGPVQVERFHLAVPYTWAGQRVQIVAAGAEVADQLTRSVDGQPRPTSIGDIARWLRRRRNDGDLYLMVVRHGPGLRANVDAMPLLPPSEVAELSGAPQTQRREMGVAWEESRERPGVVHGGARTSVQVMQY